MSETVAEPTPQQPASRSLEDTLASLNDDDRKFVLDQVSKARSEARGLRDRVKAAEPQLEELAKLKQASQTELERWQSFGKQNEERANTAERDLTRLRVAYDMGLPKELASRLQGDDEATLREDAKTLLSLVPQDTSPRAPRVDPSQGSSSGSRGNASPGEQFASILHQQMGR